MSGFILDEAITFAVRAHAGMVRKAGAQPYILHPMEAAVIVGTMTNDPELLAAALLHDVVEDTGVTPEEIEERFGRRVRDLVASETENKRSDRPAEDTWKIRKSETIAYLQNAAGIEEKILCLGDKLSNLRSMRRGWKTMGDAFWLQFNQKDPSMHHWYYRSIADAMEELSPHAAWQEFDQLIRELFER